MQYYAVVGPYPVMKDDGFLEKRKFITKLTQADAKNYFSKQDGPFLLVKDFENAKSVSVLLTILQAKRLDKGQYQNRHLRFTHLIYKVEVDRSAEMREDEVSTMPIAGDTLVEHWEARALSFYGLWSEKIKTYSVDKPAIQEVLGVNCIHPAFKQKYLDFSEQQKKEVGQGACFCLVV